MEGTAVETTIFQKRLEVVAKLQHNSMQLQQQFDDLNQYCDGLLTKVEAQTNAISSLAPKMSARQKQLKEAYEQVLDFSSQQDFKCGLKDLNEYIKLERALCHAIASDLEAESPTETKPGLSLNYVHSLLQKKRFEEALEQLTIAKL